MRLAKNREKTQIWKIYPLNNKPRQNDGVCQQSEAPPVSAGFFVSIRQALATCDL